MARTAERYLKNTRQTRETIKIYAAGNYLRLSVDCDYTGSDSLENQRKLAQEYAGRYPGLNIVREYVDDGKTGTDFSRPAFNRMIADLKSGRINCVMVKDLSRFGREYIEAGNYIEKVFPLLEVRFISIVDGYDSADGDCSRELLLIALKNLMHEMYAKDISKKVGSTFQMKQERRSFYRSPVIPYGYRMNEGGTNYIICEQTAPIVKEIFRQCSRGKSIYAISRWLYENRIQTPQQYLQSGSVYQEPQRELKVWQYSTIKRMLENPVYLGSLVRHKSEQSFYAEKKSAFVPEQEQIVMENNHAPLVDRQMFEEVQGNLTRRKGKTPAAGCDKAVVPEENVFQGKLFCGSCKANMVRTCANRTIHGKPLQYKVFRCSSHRKHYSICDTRHITEEMLCDIFYHTVQKQISLTEKIQKQAERAVRASFQESLKQTEHKRQRVIYTENLLEREYMEKYSEYVQSRITQVEFLQYKSRYDEKMQHCRQQETAYTKEEKRKKEYRAAQQKSISDWLCFENTKELTAEMIEICVDKIELFADNRVEITLKYQDCFLCADRVSE